MTTGVIVQARLGSKRFPKKVLANFNGAPILRHVLDRAKEIGPVVILATPDFYLTAFHENYHLGSENDVLWRFTEAARAYRLENIVRITADCPLLRPDLCRRVLELYRRSGVSYAAIDWPHGGFPKGYGCEIFTMTALELANAFAKDQYDREHVTPWMQRHLRCKYLQNDKDESHLNYCVDVPEDIGRLETIIRKNKA